MLIIMCLGLLIGSFLNVCIYRIPRHEEIVYTPSHCMACGHQIKWYDLVPVFSYLLLKGRCRQCHTKLSAQYPLIELTNALAYGGIFLVYGFSVESFLFMVVFSVLLVISIIDIHHYIIPNKTVLFIIVIGLAYQIIYKHEFIDAAIGFFAASGILMLMYFASKGKMGMGDVKLMAACGIILGWQEIFLALFIGSVIGSVIGLGLIGLKIMDRKQMIPFGPYLSAGVIIAGLWGQAIINWYINLIF